MADNTGENQNRQPYKAPEKRFLRAGEGSRALSADDPLVRLIISYSDLQPEIASYYGRQEPTLQRFLAVVEQAGLLHPELTLQYAVWLRDPKGGKGNQKLAPWVLAVLAGIPNSLSHPRFAELVARCIIRPDDALYIIQAVHIHLGDNRSPDPLKQGIARGLEKMSDYQLARYLNHHLSLYEQKQEGQTDVQEPIAENDSEQSASSVEAENQPADERSEKNTLRMVDVLGICKSELNPRLFAHYRYLHAPTRLQPAVLTELSNELPVIAAQRKLRTNPPQDTADVHNWIRKALQARMTMEQMFSATGMPSGQRQQLQRLVRKNASSEKNKEQLSEEEKQQHQTLLASLRQIEIQQRRIRAELWKTLAVVRVPDEDTPGKTVPFLGDVAFLRNIRGMYQAGVSLESLVIEARHRRFTGLLPFQILIADQQISLGRQRGKYRANACPEVRPVLDAIFEKVGAALLPRKSDGNLYRIVGLAETSGSMRVPLVGKETTTATCMDAAIAFSVAFSFTTRAQHYGGVAGTWSEHFHAAIGAPNEGPLGIAERVFQSGGWGGDEAHLFSGFISLINWLLQHPEVPRPETLVIFSARPFHIQPKMEPALLQVLPLPYQQWLQKPTFRYLPPLAAATVLYRELFGNDISLVLWNLSSYQRTPTPSGTKRILMLSGFDNNSMHILEQWLRIGSPGATLPRLVEETAVDELESGANSEEIIAGLRRY